MKQPSANRQLSDRRCRSANERLLLVRRIPLVFSQRFDEPKRGIGQWRSDSSESCKARTLRTQVDGDKMNLGNQSHDAKGWRRRVGWTECAGNTYVGLAPVEAADDLALHPGVGTAGRLRGAVAEQNADLVVDAVPHLVQPTSSIGAVGDGT